MKPETLIATLVPEGWIERDISGMPRNRLNAGVEACLSYQDRLSLRYHPQAGYIRLMIQGADDERCLQIEYGDRLDQVLEHLIATKDDLSLDTYLTHYLTLQSICPVSILMVEQFLPGYT